MNETSLSNLLINAILSQKMSAEKTNAHQTEQSGHQAPQQAKPDDREELEDANKGSVTETDKFGKGAAIKTADMALLHQNFRDFSRPENEFSYMLNRKRCEIPPKTT